MYISYNWLKDFVKLPVKIKPEEIAAGLTKHTVEVEETVKQADRFDRIVVGKVLEVTKHPNADRLRLTVVDIKKEKLNIVCGAPNVEPGQLVPVALVGATLPSGLEIKESEIRGEKSQGMICAEDELGLGKNHEGILVLGDQAKIGEPFAKYLALDDTILEVDNKSLSNRPDLWSHYGLARELSAIFDLNLKSFDKFLGEFIFLDDKENKLDIKVEDKILCPRYSVVKLDNIEVKESPIWLKNRLMAVGQRPINNIVDLTNYVILEVGQPLHAFDASKVKKLLVRRAAKNEAIETLDEKERVLTEDDLLITDGKNPLAIAGIMGGKNSEINPQSTSLVLEAANFKATAIRKTSQRLGLRSESSMRFEKSLDPKLTIVGLTRFLTLLKESCPNFRISSSLIDINSLEQKTLEIPLDLNWLTDKIGQEIAPAQVINYLLKLGFGVENKKEPILKVLVPSWRATKDVSAREDLVEEILRLYGYNNIISKLPVQTLSLPEINQERVLERKTKNLLAWKYTLTESYNYSFVSDEQLKKLNLDFFKYLKLANPLSDNQARLRQSLIPGLISNIKNNQQRPEELGLFEIGNVFWPAPGNLKKEGINGGVLPHQEKHLGLVVAGAGNLFNKLKGIITSLLGNLINYEITPVFSALETVPGWADKKIAAKITILDKEIGFVANLNREVMENMNLKKAVTVAEINFDVLASVVLRSPSSCFQEGLKYPTLVRDLAFVVDQKIMYNDFVTELLKFNPLIKSVELFDVYSGDKLERNQKSLAFHLVYQSEHKTLTASEVDTIQTELIKHVAKKFEAQIRNF